MAGDQLGEKHDPVQRNHPDQSPFHRQAGCAMVAAMGTVAIKTVGHLPAVELFVCIDSPYLLPWHDKMVNVTKLVNISRRTMISHIRAKLLKV
jgi:hypothetical protein